MINKLRNMIKRAYVSKTIDDSGEYPLTQVSYMGKTKDIHVVTPYGLYSHAPIDSLFVLFNSQGQEENCFGFGNVQETRLKDLKEGEVALYNSLSGSYIKLLEDGSIEIICKKDQNVTIEGDCVLNITGDCTINAKNININGDTSVNITSTDIYLNGTVHP